MLDRMVRNLGSEPHRVEEDAILIPDTPETRKVFGIMDALLDCHTRILRYAQPGRANPYKPMEPERLFLAVANTLRAHARQEGTAFFGDLLHALVWAQGLPNTNHRSTLALVNLLAFPGGEKAPDPEAQRALAQQFIAASKPLIREAEFAPRTQALAEAHRQAARAYVEALLVR